MGTIFWLFGFATSFLTLVLLALSISAGLYLLAELAEEFPTMAGKVSKYLTASVLLLHVILLIDGLPLWESLIGIASHLFYASMLLSFPFVRLLSVPAIGSAVGFVLSNVFWLLHFTRSRTPLQVIGYFVVCVWSVPCALFASLTLYENTLPSTDHHDLSPCKNKSLGKEIFDQCMGFVEKVTHSDVFSAIKALNDKRR
ncbi:transmembrane adaptor Erv26-domain-containing protein [Ochromonadaceae sp. CCMP2298]|nr:transmembrane adaptor Erv26-domain-containing protein [Ochromonadaceae sp. CCMP2298]KAJ1436606.1 transmembrane adaptor Erv26-domain-containing protein [Ochromonadaceae sp. CCMP2298]|mmetsp:Transcript_14876/g.32828  ORF Transcript_14876/g.32828 Transcript_14876/m.32828 type:complete len:199 (+) Transcript_14876:228-824(+)